MTLLGSLFCMFLVWLFVLAASSCLFSIQGCSVHGFRRDHPILPLDIVAVCFGLCPIAIPVKLVLLSARLLHFEQQRDFELEAAAKVPAAVNVALRSRPLPHTFDVRD